MKNKVVPLSPENYPPTSETGFEFLDVSSRDEGASIVGKLPDARGRPPRPQVFSPRAAWKRGFLKIRAQRAVQKLSEQLIAYGTNELLTEDLHYKENIDLLLDRKVQKTEAFRTLDNTVYRKKSVSRFLIYPGSAAEKVWVVLLFPLLVYTTSILPFRIAFDDIYFWDFWTVLDTSVDLLFLVDIAMTFCHSYYRNEDGALVRNRMEIGFMYLRTWFLVDLIASFPMTLVIYLTSGEDSIQDYYRSMRITRLLRLYKFSQISQLLTAIKEQTGTDFIARIQEYVFVNARVYKLAEFLVAVFMGVHLVSCLWFLSFQVSSFPPDSWVMRYQYIDQTPWRQYLVSVYWAITTAATVGYGDIAPFTPLEHGIAIGWMIVGVGFYSFTIGSLSSFLMSVDTRESVTTAKLTAVQEFANETGISMEIKGKIRKAIRYHTWKTGTVWSDTNSLFSELPQHLQYEVACSMYGGVVKDFPFFSDRNKPFLIHFMPLFKPLHVSVSQFVYRQGDHADEVLFIAKGRVNFVLRFNDIVYKSYVHRSYFGDIEVLKGICRIDNAMTCGNCEFLSVTKTDFLNALKEFPYEGQRIKAIAEERMKRNREALICTYDLIKMKVEPGDVREFWEKEGLISIRGSNEDQMQFSPAELNCKMKAIESDVRDLRFLLESVNQSFLSLARDVKAHSLKIAD